MFDPDRPMDMFAPFGPSLDQAERLMRRVQKAVTAVNEVVGEAESADGRVRARVFAGGRIKDVTFDPRVMRLDRETLADHVVNAVRAAQEDAQRRTEELMNEALGPLGGGMPSRENFGLDKLFEQIGQIEESFTRSMQEHMAELERIRRRYELAPLGVLRLGGRASW